MNSNVKAQIEQNLINAKGAPRKVDNTIDGECSGCGRCCTSILPLNDKEINNIKKYIRRNNINPINRNNNINQTEYIDVCPFLNEENRCNIQDYKPEICRKFMCNSSINNFNHIDKHIINMMSEFYPNEICFNQPDVEILNNIYQNKKAQVFGKK